MTHGQPERGLCDEGMVGSLGHGGGFTHLQIFENGAQPSTRIGPRSVSGFEAALVTCAGPWGDRVLGAGDLSALPWQLAVHL